MITSNITTTLVAISLLISAYGQPDFSWQTAEDVNSSAPEEMEYWTESEFEPESETNPELTPEFTSPESASETLTPETLIPETPKTSETQESSQIPEQPEILFRCLTEAGYSPEELPANQVILAAASGSTAKVYAFERDTSGYWIQVLGPLSGYTGRNGASYQKREGDRTTPAGLYALPYAFGIRSDPGCALEYRQVSQNSYWVDDPYSFHYNQWVELENRSDKDWNSAEHLIAYPTQYAYGLVIDYNTNPVISGAGSAIFLHCGNNATSGCIALPRENVLELLRWLSPEASPHILIIPV